MVPKARLVDVNRRVRLVGGHRRVVCLAERAKVALAAERKKGREGECILNERGKGAAQGKI